MAVSSKKASSNGDVEKRDISDLLLEFRGDRIIIPEGMDHDEAITVIHKRKEEDETEVDFVENVNCFPLDGAVAFARVLKQRFGWTNLIPQNMGFFGTRRPTLVGVEVDFNKTVQIPWGQCTVPKIEGLLRTGCNTNEGLPIFCLHGSVKRKHEHLMAEIAQEVRESVKAESIYKGKAIRINLRDSDGDRISDFGPSFAPKFIDIDSIKVEEIVYSALTSRMLQVNVFNLVQNTEKCRKNNIPLKRGILLEGQFGTGKTLTADLLAKYCVANGWTFLYLEDARDLDIALGFAEMYSPCVVFAEDVDKATKGDRDVNMDRLFNKMDGIDGKSREVMVVLTTNTVGQIHPGFLRPGRIDTVVEVTPPDAAAIAKLVKMYCKDDTGRSLLSAEEEDVAKALKKIEGVNAAFVREVVERAKLAALGNGQEELLVTADDLRDAADTLRPHIEMLYPNLHAMDYTQNMGTEIDPLKFGMELVADQLMEALISKLANPRSIAKVLKLKKHSMRDPSGGMN